MTNPTPDPAVRARRFAEAQAVTARASGHHDYERQWLDLLHLMDQDDAARQQPVVDATWALTTPDLWEAPGPRSIPTLLAAIGQVLAATEGREARLGQRLIYTAPPAVTEPRRMCDPAPDAQTGVDVAQVGAAARLLLHQITLDRRAPYWHDRARDLDAAQVWLESVVDWSDTLAPATPEETQ